MNGHHHAMMLYFAYGSNMSSLRLGHRLPSARPLAIAHLDAHHLRFHKRGKDGSGKCDAFETGDPGHVVTGVVFEISLPEKNRLDAIEGLGHGYDEKSVTVETVAGNAITATTYFATHIDPALKPFHWYKHHVLMGAREHGLPVEYVKRIVSTDSCPDPDAARHRIEMAIYNISVSAAGP